MGDSRREAALPRMTLVTRDHVREEHQQPGALQSVDGSRRQWPHPCRRSAEVYACTVPPRRRDRASAQTVDGRRTGVGTPNLSASLDRPPCRSVSWLQTLQDRQQCARIGRETECMCLPQALRISHRICAQSLEDGGALVTRHRKEYTHSYDRLFEVHPHACARLGKDGTSDKQALLVCDESG